ncbi:OmpA family protein [Luteibaculum oceani]|uniref:OmpA family protein n=1 Tax=Luteibaculum oceani TaxID=1294296 RepID=A0A5C6VBD1_9FLAO|nr:OmpA family protein [Luteibaculum oceani]TXC81706.1 OmpA family protein [Luteibaculum oceani]
MRFFLSFFLLGFAISSFAQSPNLVVNGDFEELDQKIKDLGAISAAKGWAPGNGAPADLFSPESKIDEAKSPSNIYGKEKAYSGNNYAGIRAYSYKGKDPRTYITGKLEKSLEAGKRYCVTFYQSLSEDSKFAISNVAAVFSSEPFEMGEMSYNILMEPSVQLNTPSIITRQLYWDDVCNVYEAEGAENYITIGVFESEKNIDYKKIKRPGDFSGAQQNHAYYYIDGVEVKELEEGEKCDCEKQQFVDTPKIVRVTVESNVSKSDVAKEIESLVIGFPQGSFKLDPNQKGVEELLKYAKLDSDLKLKFVGHISEEEEKMGMKNPRIKTLAKGRAQAVVNYLAEQKLDKTRFVIEEADYFDTVGTKENPDFTEKNQSVTIKVLSK